MAGAVALIPELIAAMTAASAVSNKKNKKDSTLPKELLKTTKEEKSVVEDEPEVELLKPFEDNTANKDKDEIMLLFSEGGLSSKELKNLAKTGELSKERYAELPEDIQKKIGHIAFGDKMVKTGKPLNGTLPPVKATEGSKKTIEDEFPEVDEDKTTEMPETKKEDSTIVDKLPEVETSNTTEFPIPEEEINRLIELISIDEKKEPNQKRIVDWTMSPTGRRIAKELGFTPSELGKILWEASQRNTAAKAQEHKFKPDAEAKRKAHDDSRETRARMAKKEDEKLEKMGLNKYLKNK